MTKTESYSELNREGLIPGPNETEQEYLERVQYCLHLKKNFKERVDLEFQEQVMEPVPSQGLELANKLYGIAPSWIPLFYSNYRLPFWQGGCAWIFQQTENSPTSAFFQLRQAFRTSETYLKIYHRNELISHELSHIGRMTFDEPRYEELLAYRTSKSPFRKYWGPLFTTPAQSGLFALALLLILMGDFLTLFFQPELYFPIQWLKAIPIVALGVLGVSLVLRQRNFTECLTRLQSITSEPEKLAYRLSDREIDLFAKIDTGKIKEYIAQQADFRWLFNRNLYDLPSKDGGEKLSN